MISVLLSFLRTLRGLAHSRAALHLELLALRHQLHVLEAVAPSAGAAREADRWLWVWLSRVWAGWRAALVIVKPETVIAWHRRGFRLFWTWKSRRRTGRPTVPADVRALIRTMSHANPLWGAPRIHGELLKLGIDVCQATVAKYMVRHRRPPSQTWRTFLANHVGQIVAADFFVVPTATCRLLFVLVLLAHERRRVVHVAVTDHPTAAWTAQQLREAFPWDEAPRYLLRDRDHAFNGLGEHRDSDGYPRNPHRPTLAVAERVRRAVYRVRSPRVPRSRHRAARAAGLRRVLNAYVRLLPTLPDASCAGQRRACLAACRPASRWRHRGDPPARWPAPPLRTPRRIDISNTRSSPSEVSFNGCPPAARTFE